MKRFPLSPKMVFIGRWAVFAAIVLGVLVLSTQTASACPNCKDSLAGQGGDLQMGFALSIVLMLSTPFAILAFWTLWLMRFLHGDARLGCVSEYQPPGARPRCLP